MKVIHQWLQLFFDAPLDPDGVADVLTSLGLEVEEVIDLRDQWEQVVVGEVLSVAQHPNADKLSVCEVRVGDDQAPLTIVCGAKNVRAQLKTPVAMVGAVLPGDFKIKRSKIRGEVSSGMLCAASELGMEDASDGIMALPEDAPVGTPLRSYLHADDVIWDIAITPNRSDCLSVCGVARDLAAHSGQSLSALPATEPTAQHDAVISTTVACAPQCPAYHTFMLRNIDCDVSPLLLQERLRRSGVRPIHPAVDVCNAVMLLAGQPMHAFDADHIAGGLTVRLASEGETVVLLDGVEHTLSDQDMVIADEQGVLALAGVMGGKRAEVTAATKHVLFEAAYFDPDTIRATVQRHQLHTESSHRFERGIDPAQQHEALCLAYHAWLEIIQGGGQSGAITSVMADVAYQVMPTIQLPLAQIKQVLGIEVAAKEAMSMLQRLGMQVRAESGEVIEVTPPSYRRDIQEPIDLIEEICRLHGLGHIAAVPLPIPQAQFSEAGAWQAHQRLATCMADLGYQETINYAVTSHAWQDDFKRDDAASPVDLKNPLSDEFATLRLSLWPGLLKVVQHHVNRQQERCRFFELGSCFAGDHTEHQYLAAVATGDRLPLQWGTSRESVDFYDMKHTMSSLLARLGVLAGVTMVPAKHTALHPYQSLDVMLHDQRVGSVGAVSPNIMKKLKINQKVMVFELDLTAVDALRQAMDQHAVAASKDVADPSAGWQPAIMRDLALIVPNTYTYAEVDRKIEDTGKKLLKKCDLFDIYEGEGVHDGHRSMAFRLTFQDRVRTLRDDEVRSVIDRIVDVLARDMNVRLRDE